MTVGAPNYVAPIGTGGPFRLANPVLFGFTVGVAVVLGYAIVRRVNPDGPTGAIRAGLAVVPPYFVFALLGGLLFRHSYSDDVLVTALFRGTGLDASQYDAESVSLLLRPDLLDAVLLAGIVFPVAFAVTGALLARRTELVEAVSGAIEMRL